MYKPGPNKNVPGIDVPLADVKSLVHVTEHMRQAIQSLGGQRGSILNRAVTFSDLISLGILSATAATSMGGGFDLTGDNDINFAQYIVPGFSGKGALTASQPINIHRFACDVGFPPNFGPLGNGLFSYAASNLNATAGTTLSIQRCPKASDPTLAGFSWTTIGTIFFAAGGHIGTLASSGGAFVPFAGGDYIQVIGPFVPDATLAQVYFTLSGIRSVS